MTNKYDAPAGAPPAYSTQTAFPGAARQDSYQSPYPPQPAHVASSGANLDYGNSPYQGHASPSPYPQQPYGGGYYQQGPPMAYPQHPGAYGPGGYPQQGGYYAPQGQYWDPRRGGNAGFMEALLASLACCCCLDACLLF